MYEREHASEQGCNDLLRLVSWSTLTDSTFLVAATSAGLNQRQSSPARYNCREVLAVGRLVKLELLTRW